MSLSGKKIEYAERISKSYEAQEFSKDRVQLLNTIRDMIEIELERREFLSKGCPHTENPPPKKMRHKPHIRNSSCQRLWQWLKTKHNKHL